jgi:hypothetical protein
MHASNSNGSIPFSSLTDPNSRDDKEREDDLPDPHPLTSPIAVRYYYVVLTKRCYLAKLNRTEANQSMPKHSPDLGRFSDPAMLILSSLAGGPKHGYAMMEDIHQFSGTQYQQMMTNMTSTSVLILV